MHKHVMLMSYVRETHTVQTLFLIIAVIIHKSVATQSGNFLGSTLSSTPASELSKIAEGQGMNRRKEQAWEFVLLLKSTENQLQCGEELLTNQCI